LVRDLDVRRPELRGVHRSGTVRWYNDDDNGYGRITAEDGEVPFVSSPAWLAQSQRAPYGAARSSARTML
jgi:hypothetical protein